MTLPILFLIAVLATAMCLSFHFIDKFGSNRYVLFGSTAVVLAAIVGLLYSLGSSTLEIFIFLGTVFFMATIPTIINYFKNRNKKNEIPTTDSK
jgi:uncharacterized membrane protein HdeD (DUF308 family)